MRKGKKSLSSQGFRTKGVEVTHNCAKHSVEVAATAAKPYYFTWSELRNVYIFGIKYGECSICRKVAASYPAAIQMLDVLADTVLTKPTALNGEEIRFLRKHARINAKDFAALVGVSIDQ